MHRVMSACRSNVVRALVFLIGFSLVGSLFLDYMNVSSYVFKWSPSYTLFSRARGVNTESANPNVTQPNAIQPNVTQPNAIQPRVTQPTYATQPRVAAYSFTSNAFSTFEVVHPIKDSYVVDDVVRIRIDARDANNVTKTFGGDYLRIKLYTKATKSSQAFDVVKDAGNGTYFADVRLRWPGMTQVIVILVHPSEAVKVLKRTRVVEPGKFIFTGKYISSANATLEVVTETVWCLPKVIANQTLCNFTDERTGYPWYCVAPSKPGLTCPDWTEYTSNHDLCNEYTLSGVREDEKVAFKTHKAPVLGSPPLFLNVIDKENKWNADMTGYMDSLPPCATGQHLKNRIPSGYFYKNVWFSDQCRIRRFDKKTGLACLRNRTMHIFGDSTVRQFYEYFVGAFSPDLVGEKYRDITQRLAGPFTARGKDTTITFKFHGFPVRPSVFIRRDPFDYVVNYLDDLDVDARTVVLLCVGTHYTVYPIEMYEERMRDIKAAVRRLHERSPDTLVVIKSANTRNIKTLLHQLQNSEWYIWTLDLRMREVFKDYPKVALIDAWDVTVAQNFADNVHPHRSVLQNLINMFMSYICPTS